LALVLSLYPVYPERVDECNTQFIVTVYKGKIKRVCEEVSRPIAVI